MEKAPLVVKSSRLRTWAFAIISYLFGYMATKTPVTCQIILGVIIFALGIVDPNLINLYSEIEEETINLTSRMRYVHIFDFIFAIYLILFNLVLTYPSQLSLRISTMILLLTLIVTKVMVDSGNQSIAKNFSIQNSKQGEKNVGFYRH